jgi:hypothetical protein
MEFVYEFDNLNRQLELLRCSLFSSVKQKIFKCVSIPYRNANQRLQDTNDGLRTVVDLSALNSPRPMRRSLVGDQLRSPSDSDLENRVRGSRHRKRG